MISHYLWKFFERANTVGKPKFVNMLGSRKGLYLIIHTDFTSGQRSQA